MGASAQDAGVKPAGAVDKIGGGQAGDAILARQGAVLVQEHRVGDAQCWR